MGRYVIRRLLQAIPLLLLISIILFVLASNMGDPTASFGGRRRIRSDDRARLRRVLGLDQPVLVQYVVWLVGNDWMKIDLDGDGIRGEDLDGDGEIDEIGTRRGVLRGDFGRSFMERRPVLDMIWERVPNTLLLMGAFEVVVLVFSLFIGVFSALRQYSVLDHIITAFSFIGFSMPVFWLALLLMYTFSVSFKKWGLPYLPSGSMYDLSVGKTVPQVLVHLVLPVATMAIISIAGYSRYVRSQMLEVLNQDYMRTAHSKGLPGRMVLFGHALKNASLPLVTIIGLDLPGLLSGAVVTETIFAWPGTGRLFFDAAADTDTPVLMGILVIISVFVVIFQIMTDVSYAWLDPRIRFD
jgi:peptide/nickel transport system permease protein